MMNRSRKITVYCNLVGWWLLGISTDFYFWIVVTSSHDLIDLHEGNREPKSGRLCNRDSEGLILTISIVPSLMVCLLLPFLPLWINIRFLVMMILSVTGIVMIGINTSWGVTLGGIGICAMFTGLTTSTFLNYVHFFKSSGVVKSESLIFAWSSGIGMSGLLASGLYLVASEAGVSIQNVVFSMLAIPVVMTVAFYLLISNPKKNPDDARKEETEIDRNIKGTIKEEIISENKNQNQKHFDFNQYNNAARFEQKNGDNMSETCGKIDKNPTDDVVIKSGVRITLRQKLRVIFPVIMTYTLPYILGFFCQYTVNQGFFELMSFKGVMPVSSSVRWFQFVFMLSNFIFKSLGRWIKVDYLWTIVGIQSLILIGIAMQSVYVWMGDGYLAFWMVVILIFLEGSLGALNYVNTYRRINKERPEVDRGFSLSITVLGEPSGILSAALVSMWIHSQVCRLPPA